MRRLFPLLVIIALIFGASYASALIYRIMGPWSATAVEQDGSLTHMQFGSDLPRPEWVPFYPGAWVVTGSRLTSVRHPAGFHSLEIGTRASLDEVKRFYTEQLAAAGFDVSDLGLMGLNPPTAALLGIDGMLSAKRPSTDDEIDVQIRTPDGIIPSRLLQIHWRKISATLAPPIAAHPRAPTSDISDVGVYVRKSAKADLRWGFRGTNPAVTV